MSDENKYRDISDSIYTNTSRLIYKGPAKVESVNIAGDGANGDCQVYDGENVKGEIKAHLEALSGTTFRWQPGTGTLFRNGIYIAVNAATTKVSVTFKPLDID